MRDSGQGRAGDEWSGIFSGRAGYNSGRDKEKPMLKKNTGLPERNQEGDVWCIGHNAGRTSEGHIMPSFPFGLVKVSHIDLLAEVANVEFIIHFG